MSRMLFDCEEFLRWLNQAVHTLESAERDKQAGDYAWSCFKAQQSAEYALKALLRGLGKAAVGHSVLKLVDDLARSGVTLDEGIYGQARQLDRHYIPPRYPDAYPAGSPFEYYDKDTAEHALLYAAAMLQFVKEQGEHAKSAGHS